MAKDVPPMRCPACGDAMNHHADKLIEPVGAPEAARVDPALGALVEEFHACPGCGAVAARRAAPTP